MIINARQNTAFAAVHEANGLHTLHIEWEGQALKGTTCQPQSMTIWEGIHLIGCPRGSGKAKLGVVQGVVYSVEHIGEDTVTMKMLPEYRSGPPVTPQDDETQETAETQTTYGHRLRTTFGQRSRTTRWTNPWWTARSRSQAVAANKT